MSSDEPEREEVYVVLRHDVEEDMVMVWGVYGSQAFAKQSAREESEKGSGVRFHVSREIVRRRAGGEWE